MSSAPLLPAVEKQPKLNILIEAAEFATPNSESGVMELVELLK